MPIDAKELIPPGERFLALSGGATLRLALGHLQRSSREDRWPQWIVVSLGGGAWGLLGPEELLDLLDAGPEALDRPLAQLPGMVRVPAVERRELGLAEARRRAREAPEETLVVLEEGKLVGILTRTPRGPGRPAPKAEELERHLGATRDEAREPVLQRRAEVSLPQRVGLDVPSFPAVVRLRIPDDRPPATATELLEVAPGPIRVHLEAPAFAVLGDAVQEISVVARQDSSPLVFDLKPLELGWQRLTFDFFQEGRPLGCATVELEVTPGGEVVAGGRGGPREIRIGGHPGAPDRVLKVSWEPSRQTLSLTLIQAGGASWRDFPPVAVDGDLPAWSEGLFGSLSALSAPEAAAVSPVSGALLTEDSLRRAGHNLWRRLPQELQELYRREREQWRDGTLLILSDECLIPWELVWPYGLGWQDEDPWCLSLRLSRWLRRSANGRGNGEPPGGLPLANLACLAPGDSGLKSAARERSLLAEIAREYGIQDLSPPSASWEEALELLEERGCDWLHVGAHGTFHLQPNAVSALWLEGERALVPDDLVGPRLEEHLQRRRPGFFFNACHGARMGPGWSRLEGWADHLLTLGAGMFLAPLWEVDDAAAFLLARTFYRELLTGVAVAQALRLARRRVRRSGNPAWAAYSLYAHPNAGRLA